MNKIFVCQKAFSIIESLFAFIFFFALVVTYYSFTWNELFMLESIKFLSIIVFTTIICVYEFNIFIFLFRLMLTNKIKDRYRKYIYGFQLNVLSVIYSLLLLGLMYGDYINENVFGHPMASVIVMFLLPSTIVLLLFIFSNLLKKIKMI